MLSDLIVGALLVLHLGPGETKPGHMHGQWPLPSWVLDIEGGPTSGAKLWEVKIQILHLFPINWKILEGESWLEDVHIDGFLFSQHQHSLV